MGKGIKKAVSLGVSLAILALIYWKLSRAGQLAELGRVFAQCDRVWMAVSLLMVVPLTAATAWRLQQLMPRGQGTLSFGEANKLILAASVLNLVLPSKAGDIAKSAFMARRGHLSGPLALALVVFEKSCDMLSLLLWCVFGLVWLGLGAANVDWAAVAVQVGLPQWSGHLGLAWALALAGVLALLVPGVALLASRRFAGFFFGCAEKVARGKVEKLRVAWDEMHAAFWRSPGQLILVAGTSVFIWLLHLLQIWLFILALKAWAPFGANLALSPLAILAGLMPLTFAGVGTRDVALVVLYAPFFPAATAAALGLLCTVRYVLPAIGGLPFFGELWRK